MARAEAKLEKAILALLAEHSEGLSVNAIASDEALIADFPRLDLQARVAAANKLLADKRVVVFTRGADSKDGSLIFKLAGAQDAKTKGLNSEELLVYQVIKAAGNTGVWTKDIKMKTNLGQPQINKIIKALEGRALIKAVKNVNNPSKKLYMLAELEPSTEITGGAWYSHQQLDVEFIEQLASVCLRIITSAEARGEHLSLPQATVAVNNSGITRVVLGEEDIAKILNTLVADGKLEKIDGLDGSECYRPAVLSVPAQTALTSIPCGVCPVIDQCREGAQISPQTCVYYQKWLEF